MKLNRPPDFNWVKSLPEPFMLPLVHPLVRASLMRHVSGDVLPGHLGSKPPTCGLQIFPSTVFHLNTSFLFRWSSKLGRGIGRSHEHFTGIYTGIPRFPILLLNCILSLINDSVRACRVLIVWGSSLLPCSLPSQRWVFCSSSWSLIPVPLTEMGSPSNLCSTRALRAWHHLPGMVV